MIGLVSQVLERSHDFYRRLGLDFQDTVGAHREVQLPGGLTFFIDGRPSVWHPRFEERPYPWLLEFYFDSLGDLRAKIDELTGAGYELIDEPYDNGYGMWFAFVADPDGNTVLLSSQQSKDDD